MNQYPEGAIHLVEKFVAKDFDKAKWKDLCEDLAEFFGVKKEDLSTSIKNSVQKAFLDDPTFRDITVEHPEWQGRKTHPEKAEVWDYRQKNEFWTKDECEHVLRVVKGFFSKVNLSPAP